MSFTFKYEPNFFTKKTCDEMVELMNRVSAMPPDSLCPDSVTYPALFNNLFTPELISQCEDVFGVQLYPTYSYARIYTEGDRLKPHSDRPSCEYSFTINLYNSDEPWAINMKSYIIDRHESILLTPGDACFYKGMENLHWRDPLESGEVYQAFFHFVDKNGRFSNYKYDEHDQMLDPATLYDLNNG